MEPQTHTTTKIITTDNSKASAKINTQKEEEKKFTQNANPSTN